MPELAELKLTADYVNLNSKGITYVNIEKNPEHKGANLEIPFKYFNVLAESQGKEIVMTIKDQDSDMSIPVRMTMGMSGHFKVTNTGSEPKHAHLKFYRKDGTTLSFVDVRRFGKWKQGESWSSNRGPDPTTNFQDFVRNIKSNLHRKDFDKPIHEALMNQKWFNGIGNYLRAEIMYRVDVNPFTSAREALTSNPEIYQLCKILPMQAYKLGGGKIKDWENPFGKQIEAESWSEFMQCYGNPTMSKITDKNGRTFWYDPKWDTYDKDWCHYSGMPSPFAYQKKQ